jgi:hypothetical protein
MAFPVQVRLPAGPEPEVAAVSKDISANGIYLSLAQPCDPGSELEFELALPPELCQGNQVRIRCTGKVVRVERPDMEGWIGVAATIEKYKFLKT